MEGQPFPDTEFLRTHFANIKLTILLPRIGIWTVQLMVQKLKKVKSQKVSLMFFYFLFKGWDYKWMF